MMTWRLDTSWHAGQELSAVLFKDLITSASHEILICCNVASRKMKPFPLDNSHFSCEFMDGHVCLQPLPTFQVLFDKAKNRNIRKQMLHI